MSQKLSANTTLSHYRIVSPISAGGLGEVFLAEDTRLNRKAAVKLLPADFAKDEDRLRRFRQEAKALLDELPPYFPNRAPKIYRASGRKTQQ